MPTMARPLKCTAFAKSSRNGSALVPAIASCTGRTPVSDSKRARSVSYKMRESPRIAIFTSPTSSRRRCSAQNEGPSSRSPACRPSVRMRHSHAPIAIRTSDKAAARMRGQGWAGMSRTGTGWATPGRSEAVRRTKPGAVVGVLELEIDEGIACALLDDDCERQCCPNSHQEYSGRAGEHALECVCAHQPVCADQTANDRGRNEDFDSGNDGRRG